MTFEKLLCSVSRAASQRHGILRKSWLVFPDRGLLVRCFRSFLLPGLEYCSAVWCSAADTHHRLLDSVVSDASFLTGSVFYCSSSICGLLCMLYKSRCNLMHPLYGATSTVCPSARYKRNFGPTSVYLCTSSLQNLALPHDFYFSLSVSVECGLAYSEFDGVGLAGFKSSASAFLFA